MLIAALCALAIGAGAGIFLAFRHFTRKHLPVWVALLHGLGGATGFTFVLLVVVQHPDFRLARQALYLFIVTIVLGVVNLLFHVRKKRHRTSLIVMHALVAVSGVLTLIYAIFAGEPAPATAAVPSAAPTPAAPAETASAQAAPATTSEPAVADAPSGAPSPAAPSTAKELELDASVRAALSKPIRFATKSAQVAPESLGDLAELARVLKQHPEIELVEVQGHADERGDDARNIELTRGRAAVVVEALAARGIERKRLVGAGYGARCPADTECQSASAPESCHAPERWNDDRRVVLVPLKVGKTAFRGEVVCARGAELIPQEHREYQEP